MTPMATSRALSTPRSPRPPRWSTTPTTISTASHKPLRRLTLPRGAPNAGHNMIEKWSYDSLGNILTDATTTLSGGWATTTYSYAGTSYANPDAATAIGGVSLTYDNSGNQLTGFGVTKTWDWRNHLGTSVIGATTTIYAYDESDKRARVETPDIVYHYPNDYFSQEWPNNNPTRHVFLNGRSIVTLNGATSSDTVNYTFSDPLNSTGVTADSNNHVQEVTDYAPYGAMQNHDQLAGYSEQRKYIGQFSDPTGLSYLNARYYNSAQGQFLSEDPVFLGNPLDQDLTNPQSFNSYSYANDNPITSKDPTGRSPAIAIPLAKIVATLYVIAAILSSPQLQHASGQATSAILNQSVQIVQSVSAYHPLNMRQSTVMQTSLINTGVSVGTKSRINTTPLIQQNSVPWTNINLSDNQNAKGTPKPIDAPSGTKPIDNVGLPRDVIHDIKNDIGARPNDWTGVTPNGDVVTAGPDGRTINHGPVDSWKYGPGGSSQR